MSDSQTVAGMLRSLLGEGDRVENGVEWRRDPKEYGLVRWGRGEWLGVYRIIVPRYWLTIKRRVLKPCFESEDS